MVKGKPGNTRAIIKWLTLYMALCAMWLAFSGIFSAYFIVAGLVSGMVALWLSAKLGWRVPTSGWVASPKAVAYIMWLAKEVVVSSLQVMRMIVSGTPRVRPVTAWIARKHLDDESNLALSLYANSITLTPGTVCMVAEKERVLVHSLTPENMDALEEGVMEHKVHSAIAAGGHA